MRNYYFIDWEARNCYSPRRSSPMPAVGDDLTDHFQFCLRGFQPALEPCGVRRRRTMLRNRFVMMAGALSAGLACCSAAMAASVGINFTGGGNGSSPAVSMASTDSAGVIPQTNYNNFS